MRSRGEVIKSLASCQRLPYQQRMNFISNELFTFNELLQVNEKILRKYIDKGLPQMLKDVDSVFKNDGKVYTITAIKGKSICDHGFSSRELTMKYPELLITHNLDINPNAPSVGDILKDRINKLVILDRKSNEWIDTDKMKEGEV